MPTRVVLDPYCRIRRGSGRILIARWGIHALRPALGMDCTLPCMLRPAHSVGGICPSTFSNELLLVLGLHTHIAQCHRFNSETVFSPNRAIVTSSSSCFPSSLHLGPRDPRLEMRLAVRLAIRLRHVIRMCVPLHCTRSQPCRGFRVSYQRSCDPQTRFRILPFQRSRYIQLCQTG